MRIYGSSPLYNYVELLFRCRRMFIIAVILGVLATSWAASMRHTKYEAEMIIALTGDTTASSSSGAHGQPDPSREGVVRKARRLVDLWLPADPTFLSEVVTNAEIDRSYPDKTKETLVRDVRRAIDIDSGLINGQYLRVSIVWPDAEEAEKILGQLYSVFARKTVAEETSVQTDKLTLLEKQFAQYDADANAKAKARTDYLKDHYWQNPQLLGSTTVSLSALTEQISGLKGDRADAESRLAMARRLLQKTPARILADEKQRLSVDRPDLALKDQKKEMEAQLAQLKSRYTDLAPPVVEMKKRIADLDQQIADSQKTPAVERNDGTERTTVLNPQYTYLKRAEYQLGMVIGGIDKKVAQLDRLVARNEERLRAMPDEDVNFQKIQVDYNLADNLRNQLRNQLYALRIEAERNKMTQGLLVKQEIPPKAQPMNESAKSVVLYVAGPLLGIFLAFCFSLLAEMMDHSLRTPIEVEKHLGKPVLAVIPRMQSPQDARAQIGGRGANTSITS